MLPFVADRRRNNAPVLPAAAPHFVADLLSTSPSARAAIAKLGMRGLGATTPMLTIKGPAPPVRITATYPTPQPAPSPVVPVNITYVTPTPAPSPYTADQLALIQAGVPNVTPATNPSELTPDQLNQADAYQTMQNITAAGGQLSPDQLQSLQAFYQAQAFANSPYVSGAAPVDTTGTLTDFIASVPTWAWIAGGVGLIFLMRGRK